MSLDIGDALRDGAERTVERTGLVLMAGFAVLGLSTAIVQQTYLDWYVEWLAGSGAAPGAFDPGAAAQPLSLGLPIGATIAAWTAVALVAEALRIVAVRTFVGGHTDAIPADVATRNLPLATLNGFVGGIVVAVLVTLGTIALVIPGVFLAVTFVFVRQEIAVEDKNFVDAMVGSWELTSGNRVALLVLGVVWIALYLVALVAGVSVAALLPTGSPVGPILGVLVRVPVVVFTVATAASAYVQLTGEAPAAPEPDDEEDDPWDDPPGVDL